MIEKNNKQMIKNDKKNSITNGSQQQRTALQTT